jgi:hypothetical protein
MTDSRASRQEGSYPGDGSRDTSAYQLPAGS